MKKRKLVSAAMMAAAMILAAQAAVMAETKYVKGDGVYIRSAPEKDPGNIVGQLYRGDPVEVLETGANWAKTTKGYVAKEFLTDSKPAETSSSASSGSASSGSASSDSSSYSGGSAQSVAEVPAGVTVQNVSLTGDMRFAEYSKIHTGSAVLYKNTQGSHGDIVVCVNAGHGTRGGGSVKTMSHPDGTPKTTGGSTAAGATQSTAVSAGMEFADGTEEHVVTLKEAKYLRSKLLDRGYSVLMIREDSDVQLDNIARTVLANTYADCHVAIHWDSSTSDKGAFYMSVPDAMKYMDPVSSTWQKSEAFGEALISGLRGRGVKIFSGGSMDIDLTQTSYSSIPSVDIELGDKVSDHSSGALDNLAEGLADGIEQYFE